MGWNDSRVTLLPPGWRQVVEPSPRARTVGGKPVAIARSVREEGGVTPGLRPELVRQWLERHGFTLREQGKGAVTLEQGDVLAELYEQGGELAEVVLTFTLSPGAPSRWGAWQSFVTELCAAWGLRLADWAAGGKPVGPEELLRLLSQSPSWQDFQAHFGWPPIVPAS